MPELAVNGRRITATNLRNPTFHGTISAHNRTSELASDRAARKRKDSNLAHVRRPLATENIAQYVEDGVTAKVGHFGAADNQLPDAKISEQGRCTEAQRRRSFTASLLTSKR